MCTSVKLLAPRSHWISAVHCVFWVDSTTKDVRGFLTYIPCLVFSKKSFILEFPPISLTSRDSARRRPPSAAVDEYACLLHWCYCGATPDITTHPELGFLTLGSKANVQIFQHGFCFFYQKAVDQDKRGRSGSIALGKPPWSTFYLYPHSVGTSTNNSKDRRQNLYSRHIFW